MKRILFVFALGLATPGFGQEPRQSTAPRSNNILPPVQARTMKPQKAMVPSAGAGQGAAPPGKARIQIQRLTDAERRQIIQNTVNTTVGTLNPYLTLYTSHFFDNNGSLVFHYPQQLDVGLANFDGNSPNSCECCAACKQEEIELSLKTQANQQYLVDLIVLIYKGVRRFQVQRDNSPPLSQDVGFPNDPSISHVLTIVQSSPAASVHHLSFKLDPQSNAPHGQWWFAELDVHSY